MDHSNKMRSMRRSFLKGVLSGAIGALGVTGVAVKGKGQEATEKGDRGAGRPVEVLYRETHEFRRYYEQLRH